MRQKKQIVNATLRCNWPKRGIHGLRIDDGPWQFATKEEFESVYDIKIYAF